MNRKPTRAKPSTTGAKALIAAASVAATIGGWAALGAADANNYAPTQAIVEQPPVGYNLPDLQITPLPTLVPQQNVTVPSNDNSANTSGNGATGQPSEPSTAAPQPTLAPVAPSVVNPPATTRRTTRPVARSRSSR